MPSIELNIIYKNKTIIYFKSEIFLSFINIVKVNIPINAINFHIVNTFITFFLYLKNINRLNIYLNNIINQLIYQNSKNIFIICK